MQACRAVRHSTATARILSGRPLVNSGHKRCLVNVAGLIESQALHQPDLSKPVSVLLQKTVSLLPRILSTADGAIGPGSSLFWSNILERSVSDLGSDTVSLKATIAVCGLDKWACSHQLVTALLEDPFTSDPTYSEILRNRWKDAPSCVNIEYGKSAAFFGELSSPSEWLQRFPYPIRLTELPDLSALSSISDETDSLLLNSDILLLLCDPVVTPLSELAIRAKYLLSRPNTILVLTSGAVSDPHRRQLVSQMLSKRGCQPGHILYVDPRQALDAVTTLQANPSSPSTIDKYQRDTLGSQISTIATAINEILRPKDPSEISLLDLRKQTALSQVHSSLSAGYRSVEASTKDVDRMATRVNDLLSRVHEIREISKQAMLGKPGGGDKIEQALSLSRKEMSTLFSSLVFWKMVWRVDEIGPLISSAVEERWCKELESQLIFQTGCLQFSQKELSVFVSNLLSTVSSTSLRSVVLENQLEQLTHSPNHVIAPDSLTQPIHDRRSQLIRYTTTKLHREAQSAVVGVFGGILSGAGLGWWLSFGEHIVGLGAGTEMGTAIGSGALLVATSIRWAVGKWERAKRRWAQDSERVGEGLTRDLQNTLQRMVDDRVANVASTACKGIQDLIDKRRHEIHQLHGELSQLDMELRACARFPPSWKGLSSYHVKKVGKE